MPTNPHQLAQSNILSLILEAGLVAKFVLLLLFSASITCWAIILTKWRVLRAAFQENQVFLNTFWSGKEIEEIVLLSKKLQLSPLSAVFNSGVKELKKLSGERTSHIQTSEKTDNIYRALIRASSTEVASLEKNVGWLATTASAAPFVGLFGTVWGIMNAFQNIGASGSANLAVVAPGISEALITTATGIGAAIPAVVAYNLFTGQIRKIAVDMECFSQDFMNIIQRNLLNEERE